MDVIVILMQTDARQLSLVTKYECYASRYYWLACNGVMWAVRQPAAPNCTIRRLSAVRHLEEMIHIIIYSVYDLFWSTPGNTCAKQFNQSRAFKPQIPNERRNLENEDKPYISTQIYCQGFNPFQCHVLLAKSWLWGQAVFVFTLWIMSSWMPSGRVLPSSCIRGTKE